MSYGGCDKNRKIGLKKGWFFWNFLWMIFEEGKSLRFLRKLRQYCWKISFLGFLRIWGGEKIFRAQMIDDFFNDFWFRIFWSKVGDSNFQEILFEKNSKSIFLKKGRFFALSSEMSINHFQEELNFDSIYWELKSQQNSTGDLTNCKLK